MTETRILVVGGHSGIGEEIVQQLALKQFDRVTIDVPNQDMLDVTNEDAIDAWFSFGQPYTHIVYTPGVARLKWAHELTMNDYIRDYSVNVFGFGLVLGAHRRHHPESAFSAIGIVSDAYRNPMRGSLTYCSSKAALAMVIKNLAREWAPDCRVNGIAPAVVEDTPMSDYIDATVPGFRGWDPEKAKAYETSLLPMKRRITKSEVAQVALDVLFGPAYLTGSIVEITGGK